MTAVCVLGLHCGGTSAVAGVLHHLGVFMGDDLLGPNYNNPKGHFEDLEFTRFHDQMIGDWKRPSNGYEINDEYGALIDKRAKEHALWGVKDPRMIWCYCQFLHHINQVDEIPLTLFVYRKPSICGQSLYFRGGHDPAEALGISYRYYLRMSEHMKGIKWEKLYGLSTAGNVTGPSFQSKDGSCAIVNFDNLINHTREVVKGIMSWIGWVGGEWPFDDYALDRAIDFIDPELRHWREANG